jgi:hypothetical protein
MIFIRSYARVIFLLAITLLALLLPNLIRSSQAYIGEDPYFYSRLSSTIDKNNFYYDSLSYSGRQFIYSLGQPLIFLFFSKFLPDSIIINVIPIIFALISLLLFYLILKEFYVEPNVNYLSLLILAISPPFIYIFTSYNKFTFITLLLLLTFYLFIKKDKTLNIISYILFFIVPYFGYQYSILALLLTLIYCIKAKDTKRFYIMLLITLLSLIIAYLPNIIRYGFSESAKFDKSLRYQSLFSDLGGDFGISVFIIFLSFFGLSYLWNSKYKYWPIYLALILFIIFVLYLPNSIIYLNFILAFLSALGLIYLIRSKWESEIIRKLTMWLLILGLLFSTTTFIGETSAQKPSQNLYNGLLFLKNYGNPEEVVFSHYSYGVLINSIANKKNVMDDNFLYAPKLNERYQDSEKLFYTRNFNIASNITNKYKVEYILVTKEMKNGLVWEQEDEGLLFLLKSVNTYKRIYSNDEMEIWRIKK